MAQPCNPPQTDLSRDLAYELYWRLLFPRTREQFEQPVPKVILNTDTRAKICEIILRLVKDDRNKFSLILNSINDVLPFFTRDEGKCANLVNNVALYSLRARRSSSL